MFENDIVSGSKLVQATAKILDFCSKSHFQTKITIYRKKFFHQNIQREKLFRLTDCICSRVLILGVSNSHWILPTHTCMTHRWCYDSCRSRTLFRDLKVFCDVILTSFETLSKKAPAHFKILGWSTRWYSKKFDPMLTAPDMKAKRTPTFKISNFQKSTKSSPYW